MFELISELWVGVYKLHGGKKKSRKEVARIRMGIDDRTMASVEWARRDAVP